MEGGLWLAAPGAEALGGRLLPVVLGSRKNQGQGQGFPLPHAHACVHAHTHICTQTYQHWAKWREAALEGPLGVPSPKVRTGSDFAVSVQMFLS